jgi:hypothetical protein
VDIICFVHAPFSIFFTKCSPEQPVGSGWSTCPTSHGRWTLKVSFPFCFYGLMLLGRHRMLLPVYLVGTLPVLFILCIWTHNIDDTLSCTIMATCSLIVCAMTRHQPHETPKPRQQREISNFYCNCDTTQHATHNDSITNLVLHLKNNNLRLTRPISCANKASKWILLWWNIPTSREVQNAHPVAWKPEQGWEICYFGLVFPFCSIFAELSVYFRSV